MKTCVIYDNDAGFGKRLFGGLLKKAQSQFALMLFTGASELKKYLSESTPDVLLVCEECMDSWIGQMYAGNIILLTEEAWINEEADFNGRRCRGIYRYQSLERLYNEIVMNGDLKRNVQLKTLDIIGIYSPVAVKPRQAFALTMAKVMSEKFKTLYINLDEFSGLSEILPSDNQYTLSDAIYFYRQNNMQAKNKIEPAINSISGVDYIAPVTCSEDISNISAEEMVDFAEKLGIMFGYENIIMDISSALKQPWKSLEACRVVYMPVKDDYLSARKIAEFENYLANIGIGHVLDKIVRVKLPEGEAECCAGFWDKVAGSGTYRYAENLLEQELKQGGGVA